MTSEMGKDTTHILKEQIWCALLDADANIRYWHAECIYYNKIYKALQLFLAIMASGTVAGWVFWLKHPDYWKVLSMISAITAIAMPILKFEDKIKDLIELQASWTHFLNEYDRLWRIRRSMDFDSLNQAFFNLKEKEKEVVRLEALFPRKRDKFIKCQRDVMAARGLQGG